MSEQPENAEELDGTARELRQGTVRPTRSQAPGSDPANPDPRAGGPGDRREEWLRIAAGLLDRLADA